MNVAYRLDGPETKPALVLSNSLGTTSELWSAQMPELTGHFRVVRYELPGHGGSAANRETLTVDDLAADVLELLDRLRLERVSFCGLSLGGMVGMALALRAPERVERLVLCCTAAYLGPPESWYERARIVRAKGTQAIAGRVLERWFSDRFRNEHGAEVRRFREMLEATGREGYAACCEAIARFDLRPSLDAVRAPTRVVAGADDVATPPADGAFLAASIPDAELTVLPAAAHLANVEQPEAFTQALLAHLGGSSSREAA